MNQNENNSYQKVISKLINLVIVLMLIIVVLVVIICTIHPKAENNDSPIIKPDNKSSAPNTQSYWLAPDTLQITKEPNAEQIIYGRNLISHTACYFGPKGTLQQSSNGMNCQNCHLNAGTKIFGNNYSAVASTYPKFRPRSGSVESISKRVNDCFERSLNGQAIDTNSAEMQAIIAYIKWLGKDVEKGEKPDGAGLKELPYLDRAASSNMGQKLYENKCASCHMLNGEGKVNETGTGYQYPPLWGKHSYNTGAGMYRISRLAAYIKINMPLGATFDVPQLTDEEAWDIAAYVNTQFRPILNVEKDWPQLNLKPVDYPFGPYADSFTEEQHKYGPYQKILDLSHTK